MKKKNVLADEGKVITIDIVVAETYPKREFESFEVDTGKLSEPAKRLAEGILTTDNRDDMSDIRVIAPFTNRERAILLGIGDYYDASNPFRLCCDENNAPKYDEYYDNSLGCTRWYFDAIRTGESGERYFERQVQKMRSLGWTDFASRFLELLAKFSGTEECSIYSLYDNPGERNAAASKLREQYAEIGKIAGRMKAHGAYLNSRIIFTNSALEMILPEYYNRSIPSDIIDKLEKMAESHMRH